MMRSPREWPRWPLLPLKRGGHGGRPLEVAILIEMGLTDAGKPVSYGFIEGVDMYRFAEETAKFRDKVVLNVDPARLIADGWKVD
jgi:hypothetical protein